MDAAGRVARRLERIEALERERVSSSELLGELRALVREAEALARGRGVSSTERNLGKGAAGMS